MTIGFIGLGVMGEPMCRNLVHKQTQALLAWDRQPAPLERLAEHGVRPASGIAEIARTASVVFLSLPSGKQVEEVCLGGEGLLAHIQPGHMVVDLSTTSVALSRRLAEAFAGQSASFVDAPIARTRQAAEDGTLSIMVGASAAQFMMLKPLLACMALDITHCGDVGAGQIAKIINNMVLIQTVVALAEALETAKRAGMDGKILFDTLTKGSADSFALRNHGMKALLPEDFPMRAFSADYALKDLRYALELASENGLNLRGATLAAKLLEETIAAGHGQLYWPVLGRMIGY